MNTSDLARAVIDQLTGLDTLRESDKTRVRAFARWRIEYAPLMCTDERLLLAHLLHNDHWAFNTANNFVKSINRYYRATTGGPLSGALVKTYLAHRKRTANTPIDLVAPLRIEDAQNIAKEQDPSAQPPVAALRAILIALRALTDLSQPLAHCWNSIQSLEITTDSAGARLHLRGDDAKTWLLDPADTAIWNRHLTHLDDAHFVQTHARKAAARAGVDFEAPAAALTDEQWDDYWRALDMRSYASLRNLAYLLVGLGTARRHAELARFDIEHVHTNPDSFTIRLWDNKRKKHLFYTLAHASTDSAPCPPECAACALDDLLTYQRNIQKRQTGPVFATRYGGQFRRMSRQNGRLIIRSLTGGHYSTRSLRAGAATSAWEAGMTLTEIANSITQHSTLAEADKYIRKTGAPGRTLQVWIGRPI